MIDIVLHNRTRSRAPSQAWFTRVCRAAAPYLRIPRGHTAEVGIVLVGPAGMRALNFKHRSKDASTDVLSFPLSLQPITGYTAISLGDLFICPSVVTANAALTGRSVRDQMAWTVVHGLLHLAGYDHERGQAAARTMLAREHTILTHLHHVQPVRHLRHRHR